MLALTLSAAGFWGAAYLTRRSVTGGLVWVVACGYVYGIARANVQHPLSHFLFDAAVAGLYASYPWRSRVLGLSLGDLRLWVAALIAWPALLALMPIQESLVQIVGFRGNAFLLPFILVGASLKARDHRELAVSLAVLNITAFGFASAQYVLGIQPFFPPGPTTELIYRSQDLAGGAWRIPSTFGSAHAYAGTMVVTLPWLIGGWLGSGIHAKRSLLFGTAIVASMAGVFMAGARSPVVIVGAVCVIVALTRLTGGQRIVWFLLIAAVLGAVHQNDRLQRFVTLADTGMVQRRISGSVNMGFVEILREFPLGNGLGSGGTSLPYFLQSRINRRVVMENEYARIVLELGIPGLILWLAFLVWAAYRAWPSAFGRQVLGPAGIAMEVVCLFTFLFATIGTGTLTSIPGTAICLLGLGWILERVAAHEAPALNPQGLTVVRSPSIVLQRGSLQ
jgi:hypothetical protein